MSEKIAPDLRRAQLVKQAAAMRISEVDVMRWIAEWGLPIAEALVGLCATKRAYRGVMQSAPELSWLTSMIVSLIKNNEDALVQALSTGEGALFATIAALVPKSNLLAVAILKQLQDNQLTSDDVKALLDQLIAALSA